MYVKCNKRKRTPKRNPNNGVMSVKSRWSDSSGSTDSSQLVDFGSSEHYVEKEEFLSGDQSVGDEEVSYSNEFETVSDTRAYIGIIISGIILIVFVFWFASFKNETSKSQDPFDIGRSLREKFDIFIDSITGKEDKVSTEDSIEAVDDKDTVLEADFILKEVEDSSGSVKMIFVPVDGGDDYTLEVTGIEQGSYEIEVEEEN